MSYDDKVTFTGKVERLSDQGMGVVRRENQNEVYFARGVWPGDLGRFEAELPLRPGKGRYQFAELVELIEPSSSRRENPCRHFGLATRDCYGCPWIMVPYSEQCQTKLDRLRYAMQRVSLDPSVIQDFWPAPDEFGYRRRAQFKTDGMVLGYAGKQGQAIAPIEDCLTLSPGLRKKFHAFKARLPDPSLRPSEGMVWNFLDLDEASDIDQVQLNRRAAFTQAHSLQNLRMREWLANKIRNISPDTAVMELFAGSGNFTEILANRGFQDILAVEADRQAVQALEANQWSNVRGISCNLYGPNARFHLAGLQSHTGLMVVNPPRDGLGKMTELPRQLPSLRAIAYISCQIKSFTMNAKRLEKHGFKLLELQAIDQMPQTPHLELLAWFERR